MTEFFWAKVCTDEVFVRARLVERKTPAKLVLALVWQLLRFGPVFWGQGRVARSRFTAADFSKHAN